MRRTPVHGVILVTFTTLAASPAGGMTCPEALAALDRLLFHEGRVLASGTPGEIEAPPGLDPSRVRLLGVGMQASVFRVQPERGEPYILKRYHEDDDDADYFPSDVRVYRELASLPQGGDRFRVQKLIEARPGARELVLEDVRGWDLGKLVDDLRALDPALARSLVELFNSRARRLREDLRERGWRIEVIETPDDPFFTFRARREGMELTPGQNNVVLDPLTLEMTLIDPG